jgi:EAL domain-containing protein (putative c-di-GMP-specific phosphodiesterase class I)
VVCAVASLARSLDIETTAEGVASEAQAQLVTAAGCTLGQGFLFSRPVPHAAIDFEPAKRQPQARKRA